MFEFFRRLILNPRLTSFVILITVVANILAFAPALFTIQVLNRYVAVGVSATLYTLTAGAVIAVILEAILREIRMRALTRVCSGADIQATATFLEHLTLSAPTQVAGMAQSARLKTLSALDNLRTIYGPHNLATVLDFPFALVFIGTLFLLHPALGWVPTIAALILGPANIIAGLITARHAQAHSEDGREDTRMLRSLFMAPLGVLSLLTPRFIKGRWLTALNHASLRSMAAFHTDNGFQHFTQGMHYLTIIATTTVGAVLVVEGALDIGTMIGANILAARALTPLVRMGRLSGQAARGNLALGQIQETLGTLQPEPMPEILIDPQAAALEFRAMQVPGSLHELTGTVEAGCVVLVQGEERAVHALRAVLCGHTSLKFGQVRLGRVSLTDAPNHWLRNSIALATPQAVFLPMSLRDNFLCVRPDLTDEDIRGLLTSVGLESVLKSLPEGLDHRIHGETFPPGVRAQLSLARTLAIAPRLVILDRVLESVDGQAAAQITALVGTLVQEGCLVMATGSAPSLTGYAHRVLRLGAQSSVLEPLVGELEAGSLFRPTTLAPERHPLQPLPSAEPLRAGPLSARLAVAGVTLMTLLGLTTLYVGRVDITTHAQGVVEPASQVSKVQTLEGGIVHRILVQEGMTVESGQALVELEDVASSADVEELLVRLKALHITQVRLRAELEDSARIDFPPELLDEEVMVARSRDLFQARRTRLRSQLAELQAKVQQARNTIEAARALKENAVKSRALIEEQLAISEGLLEEQLTSRSEHLALQREHQGFLSAIEAAKAEENRARNVMKENETAQETLLAQAREEVRAELEQTVRTQDELENRLRKFTDTRARKVLRASTRGVIKTLTPASVGEVLPAGGTVAEIVPQGERLVIRVRLPVNEVGYIHKGLQAKVTLVGTDAVRFGHIQGEVSHIGADSLIDEITAEPYFRVRIETSAEAFQKGEQHYALQPGVAVQTSIITGERRLIAYLLEPFQFWGGRALNER